MPRGGPQVAHSEDYDSDANSVKPGTRKEARRRATTNSRPPKSIDRYRSGPRDGASDSGYSSHLSGAQANNASGTAPAAPAVQAPSRPATAQGMPKSKPVLHRSESQRSKDKASTRSNSTSRQREQCGDLNCQHAHCHSIRNAERQRAAPQAYPVQYAQHYAVAPQQYQQQAPQYHYQYAQAPQVAATQTVPVLAAQPRPRQGATSRQARPVSFHGYSLPSLYNGGSQGPPPSTSAYQNMQYAAWVQAYQQQQQAYQQAAAYNAPTLNPNMTSYPQQSPVTTSPTSPHFSTAPEYQVTYSARTNIPAYDPATQRRPVAVQRTYSARPAPARVSAMPGAFPRDGPESPEGSSDSESSASESSEEEYERNYRSRPRDSRLMLSSSDRRPSIQKHYATAPVVPTRSNRDALRRNPKTEGHLENVSSSDNMDSDRTARAVVDRPRTTYTGSSRSSRRPSISTTASSGRTKATTVSSSSGLANVTVERNGRHITYLSHRDREAIEYARRQMEDRRLEDDVRAYQEDVRGPQPPELTVDNIREHERRKSESYYSGHTRKTSRSSSRNQEAMKIESGGTVIHVYPGSTFQMRPGRDGASTLVIGTPSGKDSSYHSGSRSSAIQRASRSSGGSDEGSKKEETIIENDPYEELTN